ncbi:cytochrome c oxidase assembly protein [Leifsonia sp. YIM 134122]|uniref:Cytochrome c oxidase assembly protein n=1 Tax=Leifsonia stereocauli TaxID=3134136 RepID=A0ABU9VZ91_9MICO
MHTPHHSSAGWLPVDAIPIAIAILAIGAYATGVVISVRRGRGWPPHRMALFSLGVAFGAASVVGPLADAAHVDFVMHMWTHVLGGMIAPLLLVLAAPVTLALRSLSVTPARRLTRALRSGPARFISHPITALVLSAGGLWMIYLSPVQHSMQTNPLVHVIVQAHLLLAGFLFTAAIIGIDPHPHPPRRVMSAVALVIALASHAILAKYLYANPPATVSLAQARDGAQLMYYLGAWIEAAVVVVFCAQWYRSAGRRIRPSPHSTSAGVA